MLDTRPSAFREGYKEAERRSLDGLEKRGEGEIGDGGGQMLSDGTCSPELKDRIALLRREILLSSLNRKYHGKDHTKR